PKVAPFLVLLLLALTGDIAAQAWRKPPQATDYLAMIERAAQNETEALESPLPFQFMERLTWSWGSETRSVIETSDGRADRIVLMFDEPLRPDQQEKQKRRLGKVRRERD